MSKPLPLEGIRVLDVTIALAGPHVTYLLGALGAEVVKVEAPGGSDMGRHNPPYACSLGIHFDGPLHDDDQSVSALGRLRNKRSVTIDAKQPAGRDLLRRLAARSDVLVHNIRDSSATTEAEPSSNADTADTADTQAGNAVAPGPTDTDMVSKLSRDTAPAATPLGHAVVDDPAGLDGVFESLREMKGADGQCGTRQMQQPQELHRRIAGRHVSGR